MITPLMLNLSPILYMKTSYKFYTFFLLFFCQKGIAQNDSFWFIQNPTQATIQKQGIKFNGTAFIGSNVLNTSMYSERMFKSTFSNQSKNAFLEGKSSKTSIFSDQSMGASYFNDSISGFFISNQSILAYRSNKDFSELLLFGNAPFRDKKVTSNPTNFIQSSTLALGYSRNSRWKNKINVTSSIAVSYLYDFMEIKADQISIYTADDGSYIDAEFKGVEIADKKNENQGFGLVANIECDYFITPSNTISFSATNINSYYLPNSKKTLIDTVFRFTGAPIDVFNSESSISNFIDSAYKQTINNKSKNILTSLPSSLNLKWNHQFNKTTAFISNVRVRSLGKYGFAASVGMSHVFNKRLKAISSLGYGSFSGIVWNKAIEYKGQSFSYFLNINNIQSLALPLKTKSYGASIGLFKLL